MTEILRPELTGVGASSTLNAALSLQRARSIMPGPGATSTEQPPRQGQGMDNPEVVSQLGDAINRLNDLFRVAPEARDVLLQALSDSESGQQGGGRRRGGGAEAFQIAEERFLIAGAKELAQEINTFSTNISQESFDREKYEELTGKLYRLRIEDPLSASADRDWQAWERREGERQHLGMALAEIARKVPDILGDPERAREEIQRQRSRVDEALELSETDVESQNKKYDLLDEIVEAIPINEGRIYEPLLENVVTRLMEKGDRRAVEYVLEYALERFFQPADNLPHEQFVQLNFVQQQNADAVMELARRYSDNMQKFDPGYTNEKKFDNYLINVRSKRMIAHELFRGMKDPEQYKGGISNYLRKEGLVFIETKIAGATAVQRNYERILGSQLAFKKGWLTEQDFEDADEQMVQVLDGLSSKNKLSREFDYQDGGPTERGMRGWEKRRALSMGRAMTSLTQRRAAYSAMGDIPENPDELLSSLDQELIVRTLATLKFLPMRFFSHPAAKKFFEIWLNEKKRQHSYGVTIDRNGHRMRYGLYGKKEDSMAILDSGIADLKTSSWRARIMFLKQEEFATERLSPGSSDTYSIGHYLDRKKLEANAILGEELGLHGKHLDHALHDHENIKKRDEIFNDSIRETIRKQRLFLGTLARQVLDDANKEAIWKQIARLNPSRIASLLPEVTVDIVRQRYPLLSDTAAVEKWKEIAKKLWQAEDARVADDARVIQRNVRDKAPDMFTGVRSIQSYFQEFGIEGADAQVIQELITVGEKNAHAFASTEFVFTSLLEDSPKAAYGNLANLDVGRMVDDQKSVNDGYGLMMGVAGNPCRKPHDIEKIFHEMLEKFEGPLGIEDAQKVMETPVITWLTMAKKFPEADRLPGAVISDVARIPESLLEIYNLQAGIALNKQEIFEFIKACVQADILSDDLAHVDKYGRTQFMRLREETQTENLQLFAASFKIFLYLFGLSTAIQIIKTMFPPIGGGHH